VLLAAPGARLAAAALVEDLLEPVEVAGDLAVVEAERTADLLLQALGLPVHLDGHLGLVRLRGLEGHLAGIRLAVDRSPGDALIGDLLGDLGVPLVCCHRRRRPSAGACRRADPRDPRPS
jgi:hypothetical protein